MISLDYSMNATVNPDVSGSDGERWVVRESAYFTYRKLKVLCLLCCRRLKPSQMSVARPKVMEAGICNHFSFTCEISRGELRDRESRWIQNRRRALDRSWMSEKMTVFRVFGTDAVTAGGPANLGAGNCDFYFLYLWLINQTKWRKIVLNWHMRERWFP